MKQLIIYLLVGFTFVGCSLKVIPPAISSVNYLAEGSSGDRIQLQTNAAAQKKEAVLPDGVSAALEALLLKGIPDSPHRRPLINDPKAREDHHAEIWSIINGNSSRFILDAYLLAPPNRLKRNQPYNAIAVTTINLDYLKRYLRQKGILAPYGL